MNERLQCPDARAAEADSDVPKPSIDWSDDFRMGEGKLDQQHRRIFDLTLEAGQQSRDGSDIDRLRELLDEFGALIGEHFRDEEAQLAEMRHPGLDAHRAEHQAMLAQFASVRHRVNYNAEGLSFNEKALHILDLMLAVAVGHILNSDKACLPPTPPAAETAT